MISENTRTYTTKELREICQGSAPNPAQETIAGKFCRIFSIYMTRLFLKTSIHPNMITAISVAFFFIGIGLLFFDDIRLQLLAIFLVFFSIVVDGSDGEVARFRKQGGPPIGGIYVEPISHDIQYGLSFFLIGVALFLQTGNSWLLVAGSLASISKLLFRLNEARYWQLTHFATSDEGKESHKDSYKTFPLYKRMYYWSYRNFFSSTGFLPALFIAVLLKRVDYLIIIYALVFTVLWVAISFKQYRAIYRQFYKQES